MSENEKTGGEEHLAPVIDLTIRRRDYCSHDSRHQVYVNEHQRTVDCECGAQLDTFDVLMRVAQEHDRRVWRDRDLDARIKKKAEALRELERQEKNMRERIKRLAKTLPAVEAIE